MCNWTFGLRRVLNFIILMSLTLLLSVCDDHWTSTLSRHVYCFVLRDVHVVKTSTLFFLRDVHVVKTCLLFCSPRCARCQYISIVLFSAMCTLTRYFYCFVLRDVHVVKTCLLFCSPRCARCQDMSIVLFSAMCTVSRHVYCFDLRDVHVVGPTAN